MFGLGLSVGSVLLILYIAYAWLTGSSIQGWTSLMLIVVVIGAVQMFVLALMGEYIGRLYNEAKRRPLYIVQEVAGGERRAARLGYVAEATANKRQARRQRQAPDQVTLGRERASSASIERRRRKLKLGVFLSAQLGGEPLGRPPAGTAGC